MDEYYCEKCDEHRQVDIYDFLSTKAKQVRCGHCKTILLTEEEALEEFLLGQEFMW